MQGRNTFSYLDQCEAILTREAQITIIPIIISITSLLYQFHFIYFNIPIPSVAQGHPLTFLTTNNSYVQESALLLASVFVSTLATLDSTHLM